MLVAEKYMDKGDFENEIKQVIGDHSYRAQSGAESCYFWS